MTDGWDAIRDRIGRSTLFVVEEGQAHGGDFELACTMVELAADVGANAIEFMVAVPGDLYPESHPLHEVYRSRQFSDEQIAALADLAHRHGILISGVPLSERLPRVLAGSRFDLLTVNSSDLVNPRLLDAAAETGLALMLGTAMASLEEIDWAVARLRAHGVSDPCLLHGQHVMTTSEGRGVAERDVSLRTIGLLRDRYETTVGFTDHTSSVEIPALAVAHDAAVVTKHLAPESGWRGPDWQVCLAPDEMRRCIELVRLAEEAQGTPTKEISEMELADRTEMRRSVVAARDLESGTVLAPEDLALKRPGTGLDARQIEVVVGRTLRTTLEAEDQLRMEDIQ